MAAASRSSQLRPRDNRSFRLWQLRGPALVLFGFLLGVSTTRFASLSPLPTSGRSALLEKKRGDRHFQEAPAVPQVRPSEKCVRERQWERLPRNLMATQSDLYMRRAYGRPEEDLPSKPIYLLALVAGYRNKNYVDKIVQAFDRKWTIMLFHYDGQVNEWFEFSWASKVIHISARKQTKWWFAKRFLHPDVVAPYEYVFLWDENVNVAAFNANRYITLVKTHNLQISQPAINNNDAKDFKWPLLKRIETANVHKTLEQQSASSCGKGPLMPPCASFVGIQVPVFSRAAWVCVWHMLQNDFVYGWGLDFEMHRCTEGPPHEHIGVVDDVYVVNIREASSVMDKLELEEEGEPWEAEGRARYEYDQFRVRIDDVEKALRVPDEPLGKVTVI